VLTNVRDPWGERPSGRPWLRPQRGRASRRAHEAILNASDRQDIPNEVTLRNRSQIAQLTRKTRVVATAGDTYAWQLRELGATVTSYGDGMVERVRAIVGGSPDLILDTAPASGVLPDLVQVAGGDPRRVLTVTDFAAAASLGVRSSLGEDAT